MNGAASMKHVAPNRQPLLANTTWQSTVATIGKPPSQYTSIECAISNSSEKPKNRNTKPPARWNPLIITGCGPLPTVPLSAARHSSTAYSNPTVPSFPRHEKKEPRRCLVTLKVSSPFAKFAICERKRRPQKISSRNSSQILRTFAPSKCTRHHLPHNRALYIYTSGCIHKTERAD